VSSLDSRYASVETDWVQRLFKIVGAYPCPTHYDENLATMVSVDFELFTIPVPRYGEQFAGYFKD
jgi:hypothetical protein